MIERDTALRPAQAGAALTSHGETLLCMCRWQMHFRSFNVNVPVRRSMHDGGETCTKFDSALLARGLLMSRKWLLTSATRNLQIWVRAEENPDDLGFDANLKCSDTQGHLARPFNFAPFLLSRSHSLIVKLIYRRGCAFSWPFM